MYKFVLNHKEVVILNGLKTIREKKGLSQRELGEKLGLASRTIYQYETDRRFPSKKILLRMADYFECTVNDLL